MYANLKDQPFDNDNLMDLKFWKAHWAYNLPELRIIYIIIILESS